MKNILLLYDFSEHSAEALKFAFEIIKNNKGKVKALYAITLPAMYDPLYAGGTPLAYDPVLIRNIEDNAIKMFKMKMDDLSIPSENISFETAIGDIINVFMEKIESYDIDLVVMGAAGISAHHGIFIGSNTEKVVRHSMVPVCVVNTAPKIDTIKNILVPSELKYDQSGFMNLVKDLQSFFRATLHILLINTPSAFHTDSEAQDVMDEFANHYKLSNFKLHFRNYRSVEDGIIHFATHEGMDVIAMATHGRKGLASLFNRSITEDIVNNLKSPVWTYSLKKPSAS